MPGAAANLLENINQVLAENKALVKENERLKGLLGRVATLAAAEQASSPRGRSRATASVVVAAAPEVRAPRRGRRKVTDPVVIAKRNQALANARAARSAKLRAARAAAGA